MEKTMEPQESQKRQKCDSKPLTDMTNDSIYSCTSPSRNIDNGMEKVTNTETNLVTTKDEGNNGEIVEAEAEAAAKAGTRLRKKYRIFFKYGITKERKLYRKIKILNRQGNKNRNKMIENKVEYDGEEDGVTREA